MLFPYHLSDYIISGLRITPFQYYIHIVLDMLAEERNYDALPNFTAADVLRLLGIGRNQYLELVMRQRAGRRFFSLRRRPARELLPAHPIRQVNIEPWWVLRAGYVTEEDIRYMTTADERKLIDRLMNEHSLGSSGQTLRGGDFRQSIVRDLYIKGLVYLDVPIDDDDRIVVPPLEGFVMNRVTGDPFETLLYKILVSIDEKTNVRQLAELLGVELASVKNAISVYCRLGFAHKKNAPPVDEYDLSWSDLPELPTPLNVSESTSLDSTVDLVDDELINFMNDLNVEIENDDDSEAAVEPIITTGGDFAAPNSTITAADPELFGSTVIEPVVNSNRLSREGSLADYEQKRIGLLYDSTLAALLMMGNLSPSLKTHAVTLFEAGKLPDESLDSLLAELALVRERSEDDDGLEAQSYFVHALLLDETLRFLRHNRNLRVVTNGDDQVRQESLTADESQTDCDVSFAGLGLDLLRVESLLSLEPAVAKRLLQRNYALLVSLCPLSNETRAIDISSCDSPLPHLGPSSVLMVSVWMRLFVYQKTGFGPPSLLLPRGRRLIQWPRQLFAGFRQLLITSMGKDSLVIDVGNAIELINEQLTQQPVLVQAYADQNTFFNSVRATSELDDERPSNELAFVALPLIESTVENEQSDLISHPAMRNLQKIVDLRHTCGFVRLVSHRLFNVLSERITEENSDLLTCLDDKHGNWTLLDVQFGIPLTDRKLHRSICDNLLQSRLCDSQRYLILVLSTYNLHLNVCFANCCLIRTV
jgi:hypothetical protein